MIETKPGILFLDEIFVLIGCVCRAVLKVIGPTMLL